MSEVGEAATTTIAAAEGCIESGRSSRALDRNGGKANAHGSSGGAAKAGGAKGKR
ncbi:hypothetical protein WME90_04275 [Sorangium sp. So ce375]|uniref:hypothetical protein n=1 Tax=Sorangium sp. So ce375 TaxID=3133306 RepID=UPI003F5C2ED8